MWARLIHLTRRALGRSVAPSPPAPPREQPSDVWLLMLLIVLTVGAVTVTYAFQLRQRGAASVQKLRLRTNSQILRAECGVSIRKVKAAIREIERKTFHLCGLLVPLCYALLLSAGVSRFMCIRMCITITAVGWSADCARLLSPVVQRNWPFGKLLREHERSQLTGGCFFSLGCTLAMALASPPVAMAAIVFLVLGDMSAAIIGVSFGGAPPTPRRCPGRRADGPSWLRRRDCARQAWPGRQEIG